MACVLAIAGPAALALERPSLRVVGDRNYPPITYLDGGVAKGFDVDVLKALGEVLNRDFRVELMAWDLAQKRAQEGSADLLTGMSVTAERKAQWEFATPTITHAFGLFVTSGNVTIHGVNDLRGKRVGVTSGGLPRTFLKSQPGVELVLVDDYEEGFSRLASGDLSAVAADIWVAGYVLNQSRIDGITLAGEPFALLEGAIAVPKGREALLREINGGLEILKQRGTLDDIRRKWEPKQVVFLLREQLTSFFVYAGAAAALILLAGLAGWVVMLKRQQGVRRAVENELRQFRVALDASADLVTLVDPRKMRYIDINDTTCRELGYTREELLAINPAEVFSISGWDLGHSYERLMVGDNMPSDVEGTYRRKDGSTFPVESFRRVGAGADGDIIVAVARDITRRKQAEASIRRLTRVYAVLSGINSAIVRIPDRDGLLAEACRVAVEAGEFRMAWIGLQDAAASRVKPVAWAGDVRDFFDRAPPEVTDARPDGPGLAGRAVASLKPIASNDVKSDPQIVTKKELAERGINSLVAIPLITGGRAVGALCLYAADTGFFDEQELRLLQGLAGDISYALDHIEKEEKVRYLAYYDSLTGIANRTLFLERLAQHVSTAAAEKHQLALIILDIERFKSINDAFGRQAGDALLQQVAGRLQQIAEDPNRIARVGADHFAVVVPRVRSVESLIRAGEGAQQRLDGDSYDLGGNEVRISTQAGVALYPGDGTDAESLFRNAEAALKKAASGERYVFYAKQMSERVAEKLSLENKLRLALEKGEFVLHYQPKVDTATRHIVGLEALIRWQSQELGLVPPMQFIPLLEETGLILPVGIWALGRATLDHRRLAEQGLLAPRIAVNVSPIQLRQRDFVGVLQQAISGGVAPPQIDLEITESLIMEDIQAGIDKLVSVRALGVNIAIDDFGTGYSSLAYLARLPVQSLKIDRSFIITMLNDVDTMTMVSTIISLARSLKLKVVAEGVDSEEQANVLRLLRCDEMQGYLFSKPLPLETLTERLGKSSAAGAS